MRCYSKPTHSKLQQIVDKLTEHGIYENEIQTQITIILYKTTIFSTWEKDVLNRKFLVCIH